jgi:hypothetical protein
VLFIFTTLHIWLSVLLRLHKSLYFFFTFLKNNVVDAMLNSLRKKIIRVNAIPNSLFREINSLRSRCHALKLANIKYHVMIVVLCKL